MSSQGDKHITAARKCITKPTISLFWKPDHDTAAQEYERAATCYKAAQCIDLAISAYIDAAQMWIQADSYFMAAKNTESAASLVANNLKDSLRAATLFKQAADYFVVNGTPDRAAETLEKAAKHAEDAKEYQLVLDLYREAIDLHTNENRPRFAIDVNKHAVAFAIRANLSNQVIELLQQQINLYTQLNNTNGLSKCSLSLILYLLSIGDTVAANNTYELSINQSHLLRDELFVASQVLDAINANDSDLLMKAIHSQLINFLDQPIIRAARSISTDIALPLSTPNSVTPSSIPIPGFTPTSSTVIVPTIPGFTPSLPSDTLLSTTTTMTTMTGINSYSSQSSSVIPGFIPSNSIVPIPGFTPSSQSIDTNVNNNGEKDEEEEEDIC